VEGAPQLALEETPGDQARYSTVSTVNQRRDLSRAAAHQPEPTLIDFGASRGLIQNPPPVPQGKPGRSRDQKGLVSDCKKMQTDKSEDKSAQAPRGLGLEPRKN
jgi:hypothetical protein